MEAIAKHNFNATAEDELSFEKDDVLKIVNQDDDENWYKAELNGKAGLVPSNYISMKPHSWFVPNVNREKAEDYLKKYPQPDGAFLVRKSETSPGDFSISVRFADTVQHYKILRDREGKFFLWVVKFNSINELIEYHRQASVSRTQTVVLKDMINSNEAGHGDVHQHQPKGQVNMHVQQVQQQHVPHVQRVRAVYDFTPQQADEIELRKGDMVEVLAMEDQNWWKGICNGKEGMFPATYVLKET